MTKAELKKILRDAIAKNATGLNVKHVSSVLRELDEELHQITDQVTDGRTPFDKYVIDIHGMAREKE